MADWQLLMTSRGNNQFRHTFNGLEWVFFNKTLGQSVLVTRRHLARVD